MKERGKMADVRWSMRTAGCSTLSRPNGVSRVHRFRSRRFHHTSHTSHHTSSGFTIVEVLLSLALIALVFGGIIFMVGVMSQLWFNRNTNDYFSQHVEGVSLFLSQSLRQSEAVQGDESSGPVLPVEWARPPGFSDFDDPLLLYRLKSTPALFVREGENLPNINCYLHWERSEGLSILWYSDLDEEIEETSDLYRTMISKYVTKIEYCYYDKEDDEWDIKEDPEEGESDDAFILPQFLKITFEYEDESYIRNIYLPQRSPDVPLF